MYCSSVFREGLNPIDTENVSGCCDAILNAPKPPIENPGNSSFRLTGCCSEPLINQGYEFINEHIHIVELSVIAVTKIRVETFRHDVDQWANTTIAGLRISYALNIQT